MTKKTYKTFSLKGLVLRLVCEGRGKIEIVFRRGAHVDSTARYSTSDEDIQKALEKCSGFGRDYYIEKETNLDAEAPAPKEKPVAEPEDKKILTDMKDSRRFKNLVEMKDAMSNLGINVTPEMNYLAAKSAAAKEGYDFQIQR